MRIKGETTGQAFISGEYCFDQKIVTLLIQMICNRIIPD